MFVYTLQDVILIGAGVLFLVMGLLLYSLDWLSKFVKRVRNGK